jgi:hypothetical protein
MQQKLDPSVRIEEEKATCSEIFLNKLVYLNKILFKGLIL